MDESSHNNNLSNSVFSQYSDAYEDCEQAIQESNLSGSIKRENSGNRLTITNLLKDNNEHKRRLSEIFVKNSFPIPEDSIEENEDIKSKPSYFRTIKEKDEEEINESSINNKDSFSIKKEDDIDSFNLNKIKEKDKSSFNISRSNTLSKINLKKSDNDQFSSKEDFSNNVVESEQALCCKTINENSNIIIIDHMEPQDSSYVKAKSNFNEKINFDSSDSYNITENNTNKSSICKKKNSQTLNLKNNKLRSTIFGDGFDKRIKTNSTENSKKRRKHKIFDVKNILKKAVVLNSKNMKKTRCTIKESNNDSFLSNGLYYGLDKDILPINNIIFDNMGIDELNTNYLKKCLRRINVESCNNNPKNNYFKTLIELQNFYIDESSVWVIKISPDGKYLAGGCKSGKIKIYEVLGYNYSGFKSNYNKRNIMEYLNFINETPYKTLDKHKSDIIDLSWSPFYPNLLLSASLDHFVYMWDINQEGNNCLLNEYEHSDIVTSVDFNPKENNVFISGCLDTFVLVWKFKYFDNINGNFSNNLNIFSDNNINDNMTNTSDNKIMSNFKKNTNTIYKKRLNIINDNSNNNNNNKTINNSFNDMNKTNTYLNISNKDLIDYFNLEHKITAISFFPDGSKIGIGTEKGRIYVYNTFPRFNYHKNFFVSKKKLGIFHGGKKVTSIQFIDKIHAIISTSDSLLRLVDMCAGRILYQYEGYKNKCSMIRGFMDSSDDVIIVGGEDGFCYLWNLIDTESDKDVNKKYEFFKPFAKELIECSLIAHEKCYVNYMQKILKLTNKIVILSIIVNGTSNGRLEVLLNIDESIQN